MTSRPQDEAEGMRTRAKRPAFRALGARYAVVRLPTRGWLSTRSRRASDILNSDQRLRLRSYA